MNEAARTMFPFSVPFCDAASFIFSFIHGDETKRPYLLNNAAEVGQDHLEIQCVASALHNSVIHLQTRNPAGLAFILFFLFSPPLG